MRVVDPFRLLALTFFANPLVDQQVKEGTRSSLPLFSLPGFSGPLAQPILPSVLKALSPNGKVPDWWPVTPAIPDLPTDPTSWIGSPGTKPIDPEKDPFYNPALDSYKTLKNGDVIAVRQVGLASFWINVDTAWQISYRTESSLGWPQADITTVIIPKNNNKRDIISYQLWEDAANIQSAPSYQLIRGIQDPTYDLILAAGIVVNTPDHEGRNSTFGCPIKEGKSTLDSLRAMKNAASQIGLVNTQIGMWGYSGGSIASAAAAELQPAYAPDVKIAGMAIGGYVANITATLQSINGGIFAGFLAPAIAGLGQEYPHIQTVLDNQIRPGIKWRFYLTKTRGLIWNIINYLGQDVWSYTKTGSDSLLYDAGIQKILMENTMGKVNPKFPTMVYQGVQDEIAPVGTVDDTVSFYCSAGTPVDYYRFAVQEHLTTEVLGIFEPLKFLLDVFKGYSPAPCKDFEQATKATAPKFASANLADLVNGNWEKTGVYQALGITPPKQ